MVTTKSRLRYFPVTPKVRAAVFAEWRNKCAYCRPGVAECVDHIIARSLGGPDTLENYAASCAHCNTLKGNLELGEGIIEIVRLRAVQKAHRIAGRLARKHALGGSRHHGSTPPKNRKNFVHVDMSKTVRREMIKHFSQRSPVFEPNRWKQCEPVKVTIDRFLFPEIVDWLREDGWLAVYVRGQVQKSGFISKIVTSKRKAIVEFHPWLLHLLKVSEKLDAQYISYCIPRDVDDPKDWVFLPAAAREFFPERLARLRVNTYHL